MNVLHDKMPAAEYRPGVYDCYTNGAYHALKGLSKSDLDLIHRSPAHYRAGLETPHEETPAMKLGTAFHAATLEPERFEAEYTVIEGDKRTKAVKDAIKAAEAAGRITLTAEEHSIARAMAESVRSNAICEALISGALIEHSVFSEIDDVLVKCRPDGWNEKKNVLFDLKSTEDASPAGFARTVAKYRYHVQDAFYRHVIASLLGGNVDDLSFIFIAVEKKPPYAVALYSLDDMAKLQGWVEARDDLRRYREAQTSGKWNGYSPRIELLSLPRWAATVD